MSELRKILGTSFLSLLLVIWGFFMVCSGRVPDVNYEDDFSGTDDEFYYEDSQNGESDLMTQLATLDDESQDLEDFQRREILEALGIDPNQMNDNTNGEDADFLTEELFLDLEVEIADLEKQSRKKSDIADSLKLELQEADYQIAALGELVETPTTQPSQFASKSTPLPSQRSMTPVSNSQYAAQYQDALNDVYDKRYSDAIAKFKNMLKMQDTDNLADNCQYWIGECNYALGNYEVAIAEFEKVFAFDVNNKIDDAQFMIGMCYLRVGQSNLAQIELYNLLSFFQNSEYISRAETQINDLKI